MEGLSSATRTEAQLHTVTLNSLRSRLNFLGTSAQVRLDPWLWDKKFFFLTNKCKTDLEFIKIDIIWEKD